jgi:hypothetical protein
MPRYQQPEFFLGPKFQSRTDDHPHSITPCYCCTPADHLSIVRNHRTEHPNAGGASSQIGGAAIWPFNRRRASVEQGRGPPTHRSPAIHLRKLCNLPCCRVKPIARDHARSARVQLAGLAERTWRRPLLGEHDRQGARARRSADGSGSTILGSVHDRAEIARMAGRAVLRPGPRGRGEPAGNTSPLNMENVMNIGCSDACLQRASAGGPCTYCPRLNATEGCIEAC